MSVKHTPRPPFRSSRTPRHVREHAQRAHHARLSRAILRTVTVHRAAFASRDQSSQLSDDVAFFAPALALLCSVSLYEAGRMIRANTRLVPMLRQVVAATDASGNLWNDPDATIVAPVVTAKSRRMRAAA